MHIGRVDDLGSGHAVDILTRRRRHPDLVAGVQLIEIAEELTEDVVVRREDHVPGIARIGRRQMLRYTLLQLFPSIPLNHRRRRGPQGRDEDAASLLRPGRRQTDDRQRFDERAQVLGDLRPRWAEPRPENSAGCDPRVGRRR